VVVIVVVESATAVVGHAPSGLDGAPFLKVVVQLCSQRTEGKVGIHTTDGNADGNMTKRSFTHTNIQEPNAHLANLMTPYMSLSEKPEAPLVH